MVDSVEGERRFSPVTEVISEIPTVYDIAQLIGVREGTDGAWIGIDLKPMPGVDRSEVESVAISIAGTNNIGVSSENDRGKYAYGPMGNLGGRENSLSILLKGGMLAQPTIVYPKGTHRLAAEIATALIADTHGFIVGLHFVISEGNGRRTRPEFVPIVAPPPANN